MKKTITTVLLCFGFISLNLLQAQYQIGTSQSTYVDASRNNRSLPFNLYYPSVAGGSNASCASGNFPYVVIAHGFSMQPTNYVYLGEHLAANGYIVLALGTETGFLPSHENYGLDIAYLANHFIEENNTSGSIFENHVDTKCAAIGHSMGGGATFLAASQPGVALNCIVGMAPAETTPSAITASGLIQIPVMVLSGTADPVTAPETNHIPMYNGAASACKVLQHVLNGSHCGFADDGNLCFLGEPTFMGLDYATQRAIAKDMILDWFDLHLKDMYTSWPLITNYDNTQGNTETEISCTVSVDEFDVAGQWRVYPNPTSNAITLERNNVSSVEYYFISDIHGRVVEQGFMSSGIRAKQIELQDLKVGVYLLRTTAGEMNRTHRLVITR